MTTAMNIQAANNQANRTKGNRELKETPKIINDTTEVRRPCDRNYIPRMSLTMAMHYIGCVETEHRVATAKRLNIETTE